jgi:hypothetical protein
VADELDTSLAAIGHCTVGFVDRNDRLPQSLGSGTLVEFGRVGGVLTCAHVIDALQSREEFGVVCFPVGKHKLQGLRVTRATTSYVALGNDTESPDGPDIAFLRLPPDALSRLKSLATFANGDAHRTRAQAGEPAAAEISDVVSGVIAERTEKPVKVGSSMLKTVFNGLTVDGDVLSRRFNGEFDLIEIALSGVSNKPTTYGGMSGGGLWRLYLDAADRVIETRLVGVMFYETRPELHITCHGINSVYRSLYPLISSTWPDAL